jgi:hypothetical protein
MLTKITVPAAALLALTVMPVLAQELELDVEVIATGFIYYYDLDVDASGAAHAFLDNTEFDQLYYSTNASGSWITPVFLDHTSDWGSINVSGTADASGYGHVTYDGGRGARADDFYYATNRSGSWESRLVRSGMRWYALDLGPLPDELPRVSYYDNYSGLNYGTMLPNETWNHVNVDNSGGVTTYAGRYSDLYVDSADRGHISYYYYVDKDIRYATNASGSWGWEVVASDPGIASKSYITLAPDGTPIVNYNIGGRVWIARKIGDQWLPTDVTPPGNYGQSDVKTDALGRVVVAYNDLANDKLMLAVESDRGFDHYEAYDRTAGGDGPILAISEDQVHLLAWDRSVDEMLYLSGPLPQSGAVDDPAIDLTATPRLHLSPNPLRQQGTIRFALEYPSAAHAEIVDATGRSLWTWSNPAQSAGMVTLSWPGTDAHGLRLPAGAYFCRVTVAGQVWKSRWLVVR